MPNQNQYSERDVCTKLINPAIVKAGWTYFEQKQTIKGAMEGCCFEGGDVDDR